MDLCFVELSILKLVKGLLLSSMARRTDAATHPSVAVAFANSDAFRTHLDAPNRLVRFGFRV